jgi:hypothetical protein
VSAWLEEKMKLSEEVEEKIEKVEGNLNREQ